MEYFTNVAVTNIIYGHYVKYTTLFQLINAEFVNSNIDTIDIYIDINSIFKDIDNYSHLTDPQTDLEVYTVSGIINMIAHYRNFFWSFYRVKTRFVLVFGGFDNSILVSPKLYARYKYPSYRNLPMINNIIDLLQIICKYIPNIDILTSQSNESGVLITCSIYQINSPNPSFIISKDPVMDQLAVYPNIYIIRPHKNAKGDESLLINGQRAIRHYISKISKADIQVELYPCRLILLMAMCGCPMRNIPSLIPAKSFTKILSEAVNKQLIPVDSVMIYDSVRCTDIINSIRNSKNEISSFEVESRVKALSFDYQKDLILSTSWTGPYIEDEHMMYDPVGLKQLNETIFKHCPLDLNVL